MDTAEGMTWGVHTMDMGGMVMPGLNFLPWHREFLWRLENRLRDLAFFQPIVLIFPDLQAFNLVEEVIAGTHIAPLLVAKTLGLGVTYVLVYLFAGYFVFARREI